MADSASIDLSITTRSRIDVAHVVARNGCRERCLEALSAAYSAPVPSAPAYVQGRAAELVWAGHASWIIIAPAQTSVMRWLQELRTLLQSCGYVSLQSDGRVIFRLLGSGARELLQKRCPIDLHPNVFGLGAAALTRCGHIPVQLWRLPLEEGFELCVSRSYAQSLRHALNF